MDTSWKDCEKVCISEKERAPFASVFVICNLLDIQQCYPRGLLSEGYWNRPIQGVSTFEQDTQLSVWFRAQRIEPYLLLVKNSSSVFYCVCPIHHILYNTNQGGDGSKTKCIRIRIPPPTPTFPPSRAL